jgi:hypothetical protein
VRNARPFNEEWAGDAGPLTLQEVLDDPDVIVCSDCWKQGVADGEPCGTCRGWGAVVPIWWDTRSRDGWPSAAEIYRLLS